MKGCEFAGNANDFGGSRNKKASARTPLPFRNALREKDGLHTIPRMKIPRLLTAALLLSAAFPAFAAPKWQLVWQDEFNGSRIDSRYWSKVDRGTPDWKNTMSDDPSLFAFKKGALVLRGKVNPDTKKDPAPWLTGGVWTKGKIAFRYGKIEIRAKFDSAQGVWPALWMLPDIKDRKWPDDGEIDIMEHLNFDNIAYQTVHSHYTVTLGRKGNPKSGSTGKINRKDWNVYGVEWSPDKLVFTINGQETFTYPRVPEEAKANRQWPFNAPFFIILDMQVGGGWVESTGKVNPKQLPVEMHIDWVRVYQDANLKTRNKIKRAKH